MTHRLFTPRWLATGGAIVLAGIVGVALLLQNSGSACAAPPSTSTKSGKATFYDLGGGTGNCSFAAVPDNDLFVALGNSEYSEAGACGSYLDVTGPKGKVRVKATDRCPECEPGHIDLSRTAFKKIANEVDGIVPIKYKRVLNPSVGSMSVRMKEGSSQYWFAALIDNHGNPLKSVQVVGKGSATRHDYNYWIIEGGAGAGPYTLKVTDITGRTSTLSGVKQQAGTVQRPGAKSSVAAAETKKAAKPTKSPSKSPSASPSPTVSATVAPLLEATTVPTTQPPAETVELAATPTC